MLLLLLLLVVVVVVIVVVDLSVALVGPSSMGDAVAPKARAADKGCSDFKNRRAAQRFSLKHNPERYPHRLDADSDGIVCESLPCPCSYKKPGGGGGGGKPSKPSKPKPRPSAIGPGCSQSWTATPSGFGRAAASAARCG